MSARNASETSPLSTVDQFTLERLSRQAVKREINTILGKLKNGTTSGRVWRQIMRGSTFNDTEFAPMFLWCMFRTRPKDNLPYEPEFPYQENCREMSLRALQKLLKSKYKVTASYAQLRRIFARLKQWKLVTCTRVPQQDPETGTWTSKSSYTFHIENWQRLLATTKKTPKFQVGKKRAPKVSQLDQVVTAQHRPRLGRVKERISGGAEAVSGSPVSGPKAVIFSGSPSASATRVCSLSKGEGRIAALPGQVESGQQGGAESSQLVAVPAEQKKEPAAPPAGILEFLSGKEACSQLKAELEKTWNRYVRIPSDPGWQLLLEAALDARVAQDKLSADWETSLFTPEAGLEEFALKAEDPGLHHDPQGGQPPDLRDLAV